MKKLLALLSLTVFLAFSASAENPKKADKETTKEVTNISKETKSSSHSCCVKANASCCKNDKSAAKNCTPEQKAACAKAGKECSAATKVKAETKAESKAKVEAPAALELDNSGIQ